MKMISKIALAAVLAAGVSAPAFAQDMGAYGDIGIANINTDTGAGDANILMVQGHLGYDFNDYFGVEGELGFGIGDEDVSGVTVEVNNTFGAYAVLSTPMNDGFEFFARLGYVQAEVEASALGTSVSDSGDGAAYGVGAKYYFDGVNGVRFDVTSFEGDATVFGVGYARKF